MSLPYKSSTYTMHSALNFLKNNCISKMLREYFEDCNQIIFALNSLHFYFALLNLFSLIMNSQGKYLLRKEIKTKTQRCFSYSKNIAYFEVFWLGKKYSKNRDFILSKYDFNKLQFYVIFNSLFIICKTQ